VRRVALALVVAAAAVLAAAAIRPSLTVYFAPGFEDKAWQTAAYEKVAKGWKAAGAPKRGEVRPHRGRRAGREARRAPGPRGLGGRRMGQAAAEAGEGGGPPSRPLPEGVAPTRTLEAHWHFENAK
jgi:hypothetical protein